MATSRTITLGTLPLDVVDDAGVTWATTGLSGWRGSPSTTVQVTQRPADHGGWASATPRLTPRQLELTLYIQAPDTTSMDAAYEQLLAAAGTGPVTLQVSEGSLTRQATVYRNGEILPTDDGGYWATYSVPLVAPDPRKYAGVQSGSTALASGSGGLVLPAAMPLVLSYTGTGGTITAANPGTIATALTLTIAGPVQAPQVVTSYPDGTISVLAYSQSLAAGEVLTIDAGAHTATIGGTSVRRYLTGPWPLVPPASAVVLQFRAAVYSAPAVLTATWRPAWM